MDDFTASNGWHLASLGDGQVRLSRDVVGDSRQRVAWLTPDEAQALREYFLSQEDALNLRWRSQTASQFVVYDHGDGRVRVMRDTDGNSYSFDRDSIHRFYLPNDAEIAFQRIAREFFAAHPEPKPWHDAQPGELWALTGWGGLEQAWLRTREERWQHATSETLRLYAQPEGIIAGRRIYPEVSA